MNAWALGMIPLFRTHAGLAHVQAHTSLQGHKQYCCTAVSSLPLSAHPSTTSPAPSNGEVNEVIGGSMAAARAGLRTPQRA